MNDIILYFLFGFFLISGFLFISLFFDVSIDELLIRKRKIYLPVDDHAIDCVPVWVKPKDFKKIESFYNREV